MKGLIECELIVQHKTYKFEKKEKRKRKKVSMASLVCSGPIHIRATKPMRT
jgi:hypothetical protein